MKCHGSSNSKAIQNALIKTQIIHEMKLIEKLEKKLNRNMKTIIT